MKYRFINHYLIYIFSLGLLLLGLFFLIQSDRRVFFGLTPVSETYELCPSYEGPLYFDGYEIPYDAESGIYYISQSSEQNKWQGTLSTGQTGGFLYVREDAFLTNKSAALSENHLFTLYVKDAEGTRQLNLCVSGLPLISLKTEASYEPNYTEDDPDNYYFSNETRYLGQTTIFNTGLYGESIHVLSEKGQFHERGATSAIYAKKSYALKLLDQDGSGNPVNLFGMGESSDWKLINLFTDTSRLRDIVSLKLWKEIAAANPEYIETGADMEFCELFVDDVYYGLYGVVKPIDEKTLSLREEDILYKVIAPQPPTEGALEYSMRNQYTVAYPLRLRYPRDLSGDEIPDKWIPAQNYMKYAYWTPDANLFAAQLDLRNLADFYIYIAATGASDNQFKNTYLMSKYLSDYDSYITYVIPWDMNYSFGDSYIYDVANYYTQFNPDPEIVYAEPCVEQIFRENIAGAGDLMRSKYEAYRMSVLSEDHIRDLFSTYQDKLLQSGALSREMNRWPEIPITTDLTAIHDYTAQHLSYLDTYFQYQ